ncbi:Calpain-like protease palB/cpr-8 [Verticillium longisporum]|uniref:Calpain-like protease palB/cpr-8 n=1 Tax=Verticillium longisporum TaxID=100787 RepID=A0A8I3AG32_VERLO|nr:Calpain-like protease palB/cpr-8 [Verticillium longisporum]
MRHFDQLKLLAFSLDPDTETQLVLAGVCVDYQVMNNAEHLATSEEQLSRQANRDSKQALQHAIAAADFYMKVYAEATNATDRLRLRRKCREMITWAEQLKSKESGGTSSPPTYRKITGEEETILRKSSYLHACFFPPWQSDPSDDVFELPAGYQPYTSVLQNNGLTF